MRWRCSGWPRRSSSAGRSSSGWGRAPGAFVYHWRMEDDGARIERLQAELAILREEFRTVSGLGMRLATAMNPEALLPAIVSEVRKFTRAEAGTLYVRHGDALRFAVAQNE